MPDLVRTVITEDLHRARLNFAYWHLDYFLEYGRLLRYDP